MFAGFDPDFDDTTWTEDWLYVPIAQVPPGTHASDYRIEQRFLETAEVFGRPYRMAAPFDCRLLFDPDGELWMSSTPQEHIMMANNARRSRGHVLVGGLGLGLYPQYAARGVLGSADRFTVIEQSPVVQEIVTPTVEAAIDVPLTVRLAEIEAFLAGPVETRYDTIFLDTWPDLNPVFLPAINRLRDLALQHLDPGGEVLLWGYQWMVRLFLEACEPLLRVPAEDRAQWLEQAAGASDQARDLLAPVVARFAGIEATDTPEALMICRDYILQAGGAKA